MLLTLKAALVMQELFKYILHHILGIGRASAIVHGRAVNGVAVSLHRQREHFVFGQLSHCSNSPLTPSTGTVEILSTGTFHSRNG